MTTSFVGGTFTGTGASAEIAASGHAMTLSLVQTAGVVQLQRSFDDGVTWNVCRAFGSSVEADVSALETGVLYRLECTSYTSDIDYRLSY